MHFPISFKHECLRKSFSQKQCYTTDEYNPFFFNKRMENEKAFEATIPYFYFWKILKQRFALDFILKKMSESSNFKEDEKLTVEYLSKILRCYLQK